MRCIAVSRESTRHSIDKYGRDEIETATITELIQRTFIFCVNQMLHTIALCYRDFEKWPPAGIDPCEEVPYSYLVQDMALIGIMGIENPLRPGVHHAVAEMSQGRSCRQNVHWRQCPYSEVYRHTVRHLHCRRYYHGGTCIPATERARATGNCPPSSGARTMNHPGS